MQPILETCNPFEACNSPRPASYITLFLKIIAFEACNLLETCNPFGACNPFSKLSTHSKHATHSDLQATSHIFFYIAFENCRPFETCNPFEACKPFEACSPSMPARTSHYFLNIAFEACDPFSKKPQTGSHSPTRPLSSPPSSPHLHFTFISYNCSTAF